MPLNVLEAVRNRDFNLLKELIGKGYALDIKDNNGFRALHVAASTNNLECMKLLILHDSSSINYISFDGSTPLTLSAENNHFECLKYLLEKGADPHICGPFGMYALHSAVRHGNIEMVSKLLQSGANTDVQTYDGYTAFHVTVEYDKPEVLEVLNTYGADINICDTNNMNPLFLAAQLGRANCLATLLKVSTSTSDIASTINSTNRDGFTLLHIAAFNGSIDCVNMLLQFGADPNIKNNLRNILPLHTAMEYKNIDVMKILLPITDHEVMYGCNCSPFYYGLRFDGDITEFNLLIEHGYDITRICPFDARLENVLLEMFPTLANYMMTPLTEAIIYEIPSIYCNLLLKIQTSFSSCTVNEFPPLLAALSTSNLKLASHLIKNGANINVYLSPFPFNLSLFATRTKSAFDLLLKLGVEVESLFSSSSVETVQLILDSARGPITEHLELIICNSFYFCKKATLPCGLYSRLKPINQDIMSRIPVVRPLREYCRRVVRSCLQPGDIVNNLKCFNSVLSKTLIRLLLRVDLL